MAVATFQCRNVLLCSGAGDLQVRVQVPIRRTTRSSLSRLRRLVVRLVELSLEVRFEVFGAGGTARMRPEFRLDFWAEFPWAESTIGRVVRARPHGVGRQIAFAG